MVKVKIVELPYGIAEDDKYIKLGQVYEAFELRDEECGDDFYKHFYALNIGVGVFQISPENIEVVEEENIVAKMIEEDKHNPQFQIQKTPAQKILLVADGSVDTDHLDELGINYIIYRESSPKPEFIEY